MHQNVETVKQMYAAFGRGDLEGILAHCMDDVQWNFEANDKISWAGNRRGKEEAAGFFVGIAADLTENELQMTEFVAEGDIVASFGRYAATVKKNGIRVSTPVAHYFRFSGGRVAEYRNLINTAAFSDAMSASAASA